MKSAQFLFFFLSLFLSDIVFCQSTASDQISEKPLKGKTILVTAPSNYAIRLAQRFENEGAKVVSIPAVETFINPNTKSIDRIFEQLEHIDWIILPSRKAIDAFFLRAAIYQEHTLSNTKFCAIGNDINYLKEKYKINVAFTPEESGPNGIVEALSKQKNIQGQKIAIVAPKVIGVKEPNVIPNLIKNLKTLGYHVEKAEGYITQIANKSKYEKELALLKKGSIDLIAFTSTAEIEALIKLSAVHSIDKTTVTCFGPYTGNNAKLLGLHPEYIGDNYHSFDDFVNGILNYLSEEKESNKHKNMNIKLIQTDITQLKVDVIVNAANNSLLGGGGVDGAIHKAAGPELLEACKLLNGCETGQAKLTSGFRLKAKHIIHTVGPVYASNPKEVSEKLLISAYWESLKLAEIIAAQSIAFPNISTGVYGFPKKRAAELAVHTIIKFKQTNPVHLKEVYFCCFDDENYALYKDLL